jgi:hydroxypyruvate isomerase
MRIKQSCCYPICKPADMSLDTLCRELRGMGYAAIEIWGRGPDFEEVVATAKRHGLVLASMCGHNSLGDGLNLRSNHERIEGELRTSIELAAKHGVAGLICFSGNRQAHQPDSEAIAACADGLRRVAPFAEKHGINLNIELLNSKVDHPGYQCDHTDWGLAVCAQVKSERVKLLYDIYHMQIMEGDLIRTIKRHHRWIGHFHTAGTPGRLDLDEAQEINYRAVCQAIAETGYDLYLGHEFKPKGDALTALRAAHAVCAVG